MGDAMTESTNPQYLHETRTTRVVVVQIALMTLATAAVVLIAIDKMIRRTHYAPWLLETVLTTAAMVWW